MIFVNSMSDLFHKNVGPSFIDQVFDVMESADQHIYQVLTKRSSLMRNYLRRRYAERNAPEHIWCGVSVEDEMAAARIRHLQEAPATIRFLSIEPLLGPVGTLDLNGIAWVIVGGESGPKARPMDESWVVSVRDQCEMAGVSFFFKQWGGITPKANGRAINGIEYNALPVSTMGDEMAAEFDWEPGQSPPYIEAHSEAKLSVLRAYLRAYCDTLNARFVRDEFRLDLVDGFSGGGLYRNSEGKVVSGSPLIMLDEMQAAERRLNRRRKKPLDVHFRCFFVDKEQPHVEYLRQALDEHGYSPSDPRIVIRASRFEEECDAIISSILDRQPRAGRAIFLLDQTGYSHVHLEMVRRIFHQLPGAEVILTFATDVLVNFLQNTPEVIERVRPIEFSRELVRQLIEYRNEGSHALIQRALNAHILRSTGATYNTPFFIRPADSRWALWFIHLSNHPTARDVMLRLHWELSNVFQHYGEGNFGMLGWDAIKDPSAINLFNFTEADGAALHRQLMDSLPRRLDALVSKDPISVGTVHHQLANSTAATGQKMNTAIIDLFRQGDFDIRDKNGKLRDKRRITVLNPTDRIFLPANLTLPLLRK